VKAEGSLSSPLDVEPCQSSQLTHTPVFGFVLCSGCDCSSQRVSSLRCSAKVSHVTCPAHLITLSRPTPSETEHNHKCLVRTSFNYQTLLYPTKTVQSLVQHQQHVTVSVSAEHKVCLFTIPSVRTYRVRHFYVACTSIPFV
jgi:hypothetical protein